ncbi:hypothetical protein BDV19DRAFT_368183 [Aspergillus venezuelensis]
MPSSKRYTVHTQLFLAPPGSCFVGAGYLEWCPPARLQVGSLPKLRCEFIPFPSDVWAMAHIMVGFEIFLREEEIGIICQVFETSIQVAEPRLKVPWYL